MAVAVGMGVVVRRSGRLLLGRRVKQGEPVSWSLPGGALESGESFEAAELPSPLFGPTRFVLDRLAGRDSAAAVAAYTVRS